MVEDVGDDQEGNEGPHEDNEQYKEKDTIFSKPVKDLLFSDLPGDLAFTFSTPPNHCQPNDRW